MSSSWAWVSHCKSHIAVLSWLYLTLSHLLYRNNYENMKLAVQFLTDSKRFSLCKSLNVSKLFFPALLSHGVVFGLFLQPIVT